MKCPMFETGKRKHGSVKHDSVEGPNDRECLEEECAGWNRLTGQCVIVEIAIELSNIRRALQTIGNKMPPAPE